MRSQTEGLRIDPDSAGQRQRRAECGAVQVGGAVWDAVSAEDGTVSHSRGCKKKKGSVMWRGREEMSLCRARLFPTTHSAGIWPAICC